MRADEGSIREQVFVARVGQGFQEGDERVDAGIIQGRAMGQFLDRQGAAEFGDGARIGANAVVLKDVPPGATAVGVPAKIIPASNNNSSTKECR